jgi:zinc protease
MNLREDKHWAYGAYSFLVDARGQRPFIAYAPVQTDKTVAAMLEIRRELEDIIGSRPASQTELDRAIAKKTLTLPGRWETSGAVAASIASMVRFGFPDDYWMLYPEEMRAQTTERVAAAAEQVVHPDALTWVVVGDRALIEDEIRAAGFEPIHLVDADGNLVPDAGGQGGAGS